MVAVEKIKSDIARAPLGALVGAIVGYVAAKKLGYNKTLTVVGFITVGTIIGGAIAYKMKK